MGGICRTTSAAAGSGSCLRCSGWCSCAQEASGASHSARKVRNLVCDTNLVRFSAGSLRRCARSRCVVASAGLQPRRSVFVHVSADRRLPACVKPPTMGVLLRTELWPRHILAAARGFNPQEDLGSLPGDQSYFVRFNLRVRLTLPRRCARETQPA